jgi:hypothetical protein
MSPEAMPPGDAVAGAGRELSKGGAGAGTSGRTDLGTETGAIGFVGVARSKDRVLVGSGTRGGTGTGAGGLTWEGGGAGGRELTGTWLGALGVCAPLRGTYFSVAPSCVATRSVRRRHWAASPSAMDATLTPDEAWLSISRIRLARALSESAAIARTHSPMRRVGAGVTAASMASAISRAVPNRCQGSFAMPRMTTSSSAPGTSSEYALGGTAGPASILRRVSASVFPSKSRRPVRASQMTTDAA